MAVLVYIDNLNREIKKASLEAVTYARKLAEKEGLKAIGLAIGSFNAGEFGKLEQHGLETLYHIEREDLTHLSTLLHSKAVAAVANQVNAKFVVIPQTYNGRAISPRVAIRIGAAHLPGIGSLLEKKEDGYHGVRIAYSNKAVEEVVTKADRIVICLKSNAIQPEKVTGNSLQIVPFSFTEQDSRENYVESELITGKVPLTEAQVVVSAGRGLKGPENWKMIEELAELLGAATACSKPVADEGWRPHHEHVGQTGIQISPNVYIAIGISGAIQHLAGVSSSKTIIVINKDPEAPFFQNCDYGIVGDVFEVVPKLIEAIKQYKANHS